MKILADGSLYVEKGEPMPFKCPECGTYAPWVLCAQIICDGCGLIGTPEDFSEVTYEMATKH